MDSAAYSDVYRNERAVELFYKLSYFFTQKELLKQYEPQYVRYGIDSYTYSNGLIKLKSYFVLNSQFAISQTIITDSLESNNAIINVWNKYELKALQQFFIKSESANGIFGLPDNDNKERSIETNETEVELESRAIGRFLKINKNNCNTVYAEKYIPINMMTNWNLKLNDIFSYEELEILYCYNQPVFAQLLDNKGKSLLEKTQYNSNNSRDAKLLVESVINEVDEIVKKITTIIGEYDKKANKNIADKAPTKVLKTDKRKNT